MPGVLMRAARWAREHRRRLAYLCAGAALLACFAVSAACGFWPLSLLAFLVLALAVLNALAIRRLNAQVAPFAPRSGVRNVDCLVIGELCDASALAQRYCGGGCSLVSLTAPGRTLESSYEILRHAFGILRAEAPVVVIAVRERNLQGGYSSFDLPVFRLSHTSVRRLGLEGMTWEARLPALCHPIKSLRLLLGLPSGGGEWTEAEAPREMAAFCEERGLELHLLLR